MKVLLVTLIVVVLDQVTKFLIKGLKVEWLGLNLKGMPYGSSKPFLGDYVRLTFIENPGMAFGIDVGPKIFLTIFTIVASFFIFFYIYKHRKDGILIRLSLSLILAGAIGNLIDRTFYGVIYNYAPYFNGKVVDFVQVEFWDFTILGKTYTTWPIFNIADVSVSIGFLIILLFHNRIFNTEEDKPVEPLADGSAVNGNLTPGMPDNGINEDDVKDNDLNNNNFKESNFGIAAGTSLLFTGKETIDNSQIEDTKENADAGPGGTIEDKN